MPKKEITITTLNPFAGKNVVFCEASGPDDPKCLERNPPQGMEMIAGHMCGAGKPKFGNCQAAFANRAKHPELFEVI